MSEKTLTDFEHECLRALVLAYGAEHIVALVNDMNRDIQLDAMEDSDHDV
jgi:hypothetical protein